MNLNRTAVDLEELKGLNLRSAIVVPLTSREKAYGTITLMSAAERKGYDQNDLFLSQELARRASSAIDNTFLYQSVQQAVKSRDEFLSIASHELKTPLTSLILQLQLTKRNINPAEGTAPTPSKLATIFDASERQALRIAGLVEDLMDVSRIQSGRFKLEPEPANLSETTKEIIARFELQLAKAKCVVSTDIESNVVGEIDVGRFKQILDNLISNAVKYAPGSSLAVCLRTQGRLAILTVQDAGPGIEPEMRSKIFERFERANVTKAVTGLGLGLYIVKEIVTAHNGQVVLESFLGKGSKFTVMLPLEVMDISEANH